MFIRQKAVIEEKSILVTAEFVYNCAVGIPQFYFLL